MKLGIDRLPVTWHLYHAFSCWGHQTIFFLFVDPSPYPLIKNLCWCLKLWQSSYLFTRFKDGKVYFFPVLSLCSFFFKEKNFIRKKVFLANIFIRKGSHKWNYNILVRKPKPLGNQTDGHVQNTLIYSQPHQSLCYTDRREALFLAFWTLLKNFCCLQEKPHPLHWSLGKSASLLSHVTSANHSGCQARWRSCGCNSTETKGKIISPRRQLILVQKRLDVIYFQHQWTKRANNHQNKTQNHQILHVKMACVSWHRHDHHH